MFMKLIQFFPVVMFSSVLSTPPNGDFKSLVETNRFIDKTGLIEWFLCEMKHPVFVTAPRKFGKSTSVDMLRRYFEIPVDKNGSRVPRETSENYRLFSKTYFKNATKLAVNNGLFPHYFGSRPVLTLNFKSVEIETDRSFIASLARMLREAVSPFEFLKTSENISPQQRKYLVDKLDTGESFTSNIDVFSLLRAIVTNLSRHFDDTECLILIDELDAPLHKLLSHVIGDEQERIVDHIFEILGILLRGNPSVWKGFCVGQVRMAGLGVFSYQASNLVYKSFYKDPDIAPFYGATYSEVKFLREQYPNKEVLSMRKAEDYHGGYRVIDYWCRIITQDYFSMFPVREYFKTGISARYWSALNPRPFIRKMLEITEVMEMVRDSIIGYNITIHTERRLFFQDIVKLKDTIDASESRRLNYDLVLQYLLEMGYYTSVKVSGILGYIFTLRIPNKEVREHLGKSFVSWFKTYFYIEDNAMNEYKKSLENLSTDLASQENFVKRTAAIFTNCRTVNSEEFAAPLLIFLDPDLVGDKMQIEYPTINLERPKGSHLIILQHNKLTNKRTVLMIQPTDSDSSIAALNKSTANEDFRRFHESKKMTMDKFILVGLSFDTFKASISASFLEVQASESFLAVGAKIRLALNYSCSIKRSSVIGSMVKNGWNYSKGAVKRIWRGLAKRVYPLK